MSGPERIQAASGTVICGEETWDWGEWWPDGQVADFNGEAVCYIRADIHEAALAAARREALEEAAAVAATYGKKWDTSNPAAPLAAIVSTDIEERIRALIGSPSA